MGTYIKFQAEMLSQYKNRGRAYRCKRCGKIERRGRLMGHILKQHVSMDQVPFSCRLCSFRCQDNQTLVDHIRKYRRHRDEEARHGVPDYTQVLVRAKNPIYVGDHDMDVLSKEESVRWHARYALTNDPLDDSEGIFEDEEEDIIMQGGLKLPAWAATKPVSTPVASVSGSLMHPFTATTYTSSMRLPSTVTSTACTANNTMDQWSVEANLATRKIQEIMSSGPQSQPLITLNPDDLANILTSSVNPSKPAQVLNTPDPASSVMATVTPCQDENLMEGLLQLDQNDPLLREAATVGTIGESGNPKATPEVPGEPSTKRKRQETPVESSAPALDRVATAITEGFKMVASAIQDNARAVRCQEKTLEKVVGELQRIERKLAAMERRKEECMKPASTKSTATTLEKENRPLKTKSPVVKSSVKKV